MSNQEQDQLVDQFVTVTNSSKSLAEQYLARNENDLINAIEDYYATSSNTEDSGADNTKPKQPKAYVYTFIITHRLGQVTNYFLDQEGSEHLEI